MNTKFYYNVEILANTLQSQSMKPRWADMLCIASHFETRKEALGFICDPKMNRIECRFFIVTFRRDDLHKPCRIVEV